VGCAKAIGARRFLPTIFANPQVKEFIMAARFSVSQHFAHSPERVFQALTDLEGAGQWMPGFVRMELLTEGEFRVGTEWRETRRLFGKEATEQFEVTACEPPRRVGIRVDGSKGSSKRGEYVFDYRLEPAAETGTNVLLHGEIRGLSGLMGLISKLMVGPFKKACAKDLRALAEHLEGAAR
jgi:uncharacterized protein YndB with AHSA1/START domain